MTTETRTGWKFLDLDKRARIVSRNGGTVWRIGEWQAITGPLELCGVGFHDSPDPLSALRYVNGTVLARTESRGATLTEDDWPRKRCSAAMRLIDARRWRKADSVALTLVLRARMLAMWEARYPNDSRPRQAYDAAQAWLDNPTEETRQAAAAYADAAYDAAAYAHADADAAYAAAAYAHADADAAYAAADAAYAAAAHADADAAYDAAYDADAYAHAYAAYAAYDAADAAAHDAAHDAAAAAAAAAHDAARDEVRQELAAWMVARFEQLPPVGVVG